MPFSIVSNRFQRHYRHKNFNSCYQSLYRPLHTNFSCKKNFPASIEPNSGQWSLSIPTENINTRRGFCRCLGGGIGMLISVGLMKIFTPEFFHAALECLQKCFEGFLLTPLKTLQNLWFSSGFPIFSRQNKERAFLTSFKYCKIK